MEKKLKVIGLELAQTHGFREGHCFAVCSLQSADEKESKLKRISVFGNASLIWVVDITAYDGSDNEKKLEKAKDDLIGLEDVFNVINVSIEELTNHVHKGYTVNVDGEDVKVTERTLIGFEDDESLKERERASLNRRETDKDNPITWF